MDGEDYDYYMVEKRPKYERRGHHRTTSWSRRNVWSAT
jgi:hypothetical protein